MRNQTIVILSNVTTGLVNFRNELLKILGESYRVIVLAEDTGRSDEIPLLGCEFENIKLDRHGTDPFAEIKLIKDYKERILRYRPFIVLSYTIKPNIYGGIACSRLKIPYIPNITGLGDAIENPGLVSFVAKILYRVALKKAYIVFFQNNANCQYFKLKNIYKGKSKVLPGSGVNLERHCLESYPKTEKDSPLILSVIGRITRDKGIDEILEASKAFSVKDISIQLIGKCEGNYRDKIQEYCSDRVIKYVGLQNDIHHWIKNSHAILHASYHEGMSNVLQEAAACGRPVIATDVPGCADVFEDGVSGISFRPKDVNSLITAIKKFIDLPYEQKVEMGLAGRRKMEASFDRRIVVDSYLTEIRKVEGEKR